MLNAAHFDRCDNVKHFQTDSNPLALRDITIFSQKYNKTNIE